MTWLANIAYLLAAVVYVPVLIYQMAVQKKNRQGWRERFGCIELPPTAKRRVWIHGVSLGEINCTPKLAGALASAAEDIEVVVSTTTDTGYARACKLYPSERVFRYPLDLSWMVRRALDRVRPSLIVLVELEVWPNLVRLARRRNIPVVVVNGRLTEHSARRLARLGGFARGMFSRLAWVGAQDQIIAGRFQRLGTPPGRIQITGSLKWDTAEVTDSVPGAEELAAAMAIPRDRPLWVCGSTGPGEEVIILDAYEKLLAASDNVASLAIVPRKPERFDEVATLIRSLGFLCVRRSERPGGSRAEALNTARVVFLGDTMGELRKFCCLADLVLVGRSLVPMGGSDPMEVAALARPIILGPHMDNFQAPLDRLRERDAVCVVESTTDLADHVAAIVSNGDRSRQLGIRARETVLENQGATSRSVKSLVGLLNQTARAEG